MENNNMAQKELTKNQMIAQIKKLIKEKDLENKSYYFAQNTYVPLWLYPDDLKDDSEEYKTMTKLNKMFIKKDVLYINTEDAKIGIDNEKVSEFDVTEVKIFYDKIKNNK